MARLSLPTITLKENGNGHYSIDLPQDALRYVLDVTYRRAAGFFPIVTLTFVARLATGDGQEWPELISYAPWVREDAEEEE